MARQIEKSKPVGGNGGSSWDDGVLTHKPQIVGIRSMTIRHGNQVDGIQVTYVLADNTTYTAPNHGGSGGSPSSFTLAEGERIVRMEGKTNNTLVDQVTFIALTADGTQKTYGPFGKTGKTPFAVDGYILGFFGRSGNLLDSLGAYFLPPVQKSNQFGGTGGNPFTDPIETNIPPIVRVSGLKIRHGNQVDSIQATYELLGGMRMTADNHGGTGGSPTTVEFAEGEVIMEMKGKTNNVLVDQVTFVTRKQDGSSGTYGPYGKTGKTPFEVNGKIVGFFGRSGNLLDALGAYYVPVSN